MRPRDIPSVQYRGQNLVNLLFRNRPDVISYQLGAASRLEDAYGAGFGVGGGGTISLLNIRAGGTFFSPTVRAKGLTSLDEVTRGRTRVVYDPDEFFVPTPPPGASGVSGEGSVNYLRLTPTLRSTGLPSDQGPIYLLPPYDFFDSPVPTFTVSSVAPNLPSVPAFTPPVAMNLMFPSVAQTVVIKNKDAAASLYVSFGVGQQPMEIPFGQELSLTGVSASEVFLFSVGANVSWSGSFSCYNFL